MNECGKCKVALDPGDKYCSGCGTKTGPDPHHCSGCGAQLQPEDRFCFQCGAEVKEKQLKCPMCEAIAEAGDKHCYSCGTDLSKPVQAAPVWRPEPAKVDRVCAVCEHYRKVIPLSSKIPYWTGTAISSALIKVEEDQVKQRAAESSHKVYLIETGETKWDRPPIMTAYCGFEEDKKNYGVCEVKNRTLNCENFAMYTGKVSECKNCQYLEPGEKQPYPSQKGMSAELYTKRLEAVDADIALEITRLWSTKGVANYKVKFHDFCTFHGLARPYVNLHKNCKHRVHYVAESKIFEDMRRRQKKRKLY